MAQTAGGTYYAASSELVSSWPATSLDLANQLESRFGARKFGQVIQGTYGTQVSSSSNTWIDTGLTASITPTATTSKVLVLVTQNGLFKRNLNATAGIGLRLVRGSTTIVDFGNYLTFTGTAIEMYGETASTIYLDSPSSTSSVTYKTQMNSSANNAEVRTQQGGVVTSTITLIEVFA